mmetsp:Transcript_98746/g.282273  ORF Transcript_98746/g.282273 Transcript_98746/m.282273 type:complete len:283 (-) Transcript_98746:314-1162(-)
MRRGVQPRDHARENRMAIREQQLRNRERKHEEVAQAQQPFKMQQFRNIQSKLKSDTEDRVEKSKLRLDTARMKENVTRPSNSPEAKRNSPVDGSKPRQFLKRGTLNQRQAESRAANYARAEPSPRKAMGSGKAAVPSRTTVARLAPRQSKNFVSENRSEATQMKAARKQEVDPSQRHENFGNVPAYLQDRKAQWAEDEARRKAEARDPDCPAGMTLMADEERLDTLRILNDSEKETQALLFKMPMRVTTPSMVKKKNDLEAKLKEIEAAKKIFSRPKVYVAE